MDLTQEKPLWHTNRHGCVRNCYIKKNTYGKSSSIGKILLRSGQKEERFPVSPRFAAQLRIGDQVKVHYTQGCFGLGYDLDYTKLKKGD